MATWTRQVQAERAAALALATTAAAPARLSKADIQRIIATLGDIRTVLQEADPADKARVYEGLQLRLTYQPAQQIVRAEAGLSGSSCAGRRDFHGLGPWAGEDHA